MLVVVRTAALAAAGVLIACSRADEMQVRPGPRDAGPPPDSRLTFADVGPIPEGCEAEVCGGGLDEDCDGRVDESCGCVPGEAAACFLGPREARGRGTCADGMMRCSDGLEFGRWEDCLGSSVPGAEACDVEERDEDCDGASNEGCECTGSEPLPCGSDIGACRGGVQQCVDGLRGDCVGASEPAAEDCNGIDDDCDGMTDEALVRPCGSDVGECSGGAQACVDGAWEEACSGERGPGEESCNGIDDDCDGTTDERLSRACGSEVGACRPGTQACEMGAFGECVGATSPGVEDCNGFDDDCDGTTDELAPRTCGSDIGACAVGTESCAGGAWATCSGGTEPTDERCDGALDDDCDDRVDEGCACTTGMTRPCGTDAGACTAGTERCDAAGQWGSCMGGTRPGVETCNNVDDDCDGRVDEGVERTCGSDIGACSVGTETCSAGRFGACTGGVRPVTERCDGALDDDCDGLIDDGCGCTTGASRGCGTDTGACVAGRESCSATGQWGTCTGAVGPGVESCNDIDDDCDGRTDENITRACGTDTGECARGTERCAAGLFGACMGGVGPAAEVCDGARDEDCDGTVDNGCSCTTGAMRACGTNIGACSVGTQTCGATGQWGSCTGAVGPAPESCNNADDDCDGGTDEAITQVCGTDTGACVSGRQACSGGAFGSCVGSVGPTAELCDGSIDQSCDGRVDEGCACATGSTRPCGTHTGACASGTETCNAAGQWGACTGAVGPTSETCNNTDDDCDNRTDEGITRPCGTDTGACVRGTETCAGGVYGACTGAVMPGAELCDGVNDEDCDGAVDDGCACINNQTRPCGTDVGDCAAGTERCNLMGAWGSCMGAVGPMAEVCDMGDDDCDGRTDEGTCTFFPPVAMCPAGLTAQVLSTVSLSASGSDPDGGAVSYRWTVTARPVGSNSNPASPTASATTFFLDAAGSYTLRFCVTDDEGEMACCNVSVVSTPPGTLHVELQWAESYSDVDLHVLNVNRVPNVGWFTTDDCFFANPAPDWGPVGAAGNPTLDRDDRDGLGPENMTITTTPANGTYHVGVHHYCDHPATSTTPSGPSSATMRIYCMGALVGTYTNIALAETDDWVTVASVEWPSCTVRSVNQRTNGSSILPAALTQPAHCPIRCTTNADCPTGERCALVQGGGPPRYQCVL